VFFFCCCRWCVLLFRGERERDILHDRDAPRRKIVIYIVIRFLSVVIVARVENAQKQLRADLYTHYFIKTNAQKTYRYHGVSRCFVESFYCFFFSRSFKGGSTTHRFDSRSELCQHTRRKDDETFLSKAQTVAISRRRRRRRRLRRKEEKQKRFRRKSARFSSSLTRVWLSSSPSLLQQHPFWQKRRGGG
jgi:hypothetical protein